MSACLRSYETRVLKVGVAEVRRRRKLPHARGRYVTVSLTTYETRALKEAVGDLSRARHASAYISGHVKHMLLKRQQVALLRLYQGSIEGPIKALQTWCAIATIAGSNTSACVSENEKKKST